MGWHYGVDFEEDDFDWGDAECAVEDIDYSSVFEKREVELACGLE
jgi:tetrahydromethanopterin S-methyltransferase subunit F